MAPMPDQHDDAFVSECDHGQTIHPVRPDSKQAGLDCTAESKPPRASGSIEMSRTERYRLEH